MFLNITKDVIWLVVDCHVEPTSWISRLGTLGKAVRSLGERLDGGETWRRFLLKSGKRCFTIPGDPSELPQFLFKENIDCEDFGWPCQRAPWCHDFVANRYFGGRVLTHPQRSEDHQETLYSIPTKVVYCTPESCLLYLIVGQRRVIILCTAPLISKRSYWDSILPFMHVFWLQIRIQTIVHYFFTTIHCRGLCYHPLFYLHWDVLIQI